MLIIQGSITTMVLSPCLVSCWRDREVLVENC